MKTVDWKTYSNWLSKEGYQPSTIDATLRNLRALVGTTEVRRHILLHPEAHYEAHIKRYLRFVDYSRKNPLGEVFLKRVQKAGFEPSSKRRKHGRRVKDLLSPEDWALLKAKLRKGDDISKLLCAYMMSGVRVSIFLRWRVLDAMQIQDKISHEWLQDQNVFPVYRILCETERCTYSRMRSRLQEVAEELKLIVDLDTLYKSWLSLQ